MKRLLSCMLVVFALTACQDIFEEQDYLISEENFPEFKATMEMSSTDSDSKTTLYGDQNIVWNAEDEVCVFNKETITIPYLVKKGTEGKTSCTFVKDPSWKGGNVIPDKIADNIAVYAMSRDGGIEVFKKSSPYELIMKLPEERAYVPAGNPQFKDMTMVAVSDNNNLSFKNCYGAVKISLMGNARLKNMILKSKDPDEVLSGRHKITVSKNSLPIVEPYGTKGMEYFNEVSLKLDNLQLDEKKLTSFYFVVFPVEFKKGFDVIFTNTEDVSVYISAEPNVQNKVTRNKIIDMPAILLNAEDFGITPQPEPTPDQELTIRHTLSQYWVPLLEGTGVSGQIWWGDEAQQAYAADAKHVYTTAGEHLVTIKAANSTSVTVPSLQGIISIDLSKF